MAEVSGAVRRLVRRGRATGRDDVSVRRPSIAVITVVRDEAAMLPRWVAHYGAQVGVENLVVFDDSSTDGSTEGLPCTVHRIPGFPPGKFEGRRLKLVSGIATGLLQTYQVVVFVDVDEFLVADPRHHDGLRDFLRARRGVPVLAPMALNVLHDPRIEGPLDPDRPVLGQRSYAKFVPVMCKPSVKRVPAPWVSASHGIRAPYVVDPELYMFHLKFADRDLMRRTADHRHALALEDGRGAKSSWSNSGEDMMRKYKRFLAGTKPGKAPDFDPAMLDLASLVHEESGTYRTRREGQVVSMRTRPLVRIPERFHGVL